jgi:hypothetical protein
VAGEEAWPPSPRGIDRGKCQYGGEGGERVGDRCPSSPCGWGTAPPFIGQGGAVYMRAALFSYVWRCGEWRHGADGRPGESRSSWGVVAHPVFVQEQLRGRRRSGWLSGRRRGPVRGAVYGRSVRGPMAVMAASRPRTLQPHQGCCHSVRCGAAVAGMAAQG